MAMGKKADYRAWNKAIHEWWAASLRSTERKEQRVWSTELTRILKQEGKIIYNGMGNPTVTWHLSVQTFSNERIKMFFPLTFLWWKSPVFSLDFKTTSPCSNWPGNGPWNILDLEAYLWVLDTALTGRTMLTTTKTITFPCAGTIPNVI